MAAVGGLHAAALGSEAAHAMAAHQALDAPTANPPPVRPQGGVHARAEQPKVPGASARGMAAEGAIPASAVGVRLADVGQQGLVLDAWSPTARLPSGRDRQA